MTKQLDTMKMAEWFKVVDSLNLNFKEIPKDANWEHPMDRESLMAYCQASCDFMDELRRKIQEAKKNNLNQESN